MLHEGPTTPDSGEISAAYAAHATSHIGAAVLTRPRFESDWAQQGETMDTIAIDRLGDAAIGTIGVKQRLHTGELTSAEVEEFARRLYGGEFDVAVGKLGTNAAGGTFTLVAGDALTTQRYYRPGMRADDHSRRLYEWLIDNADTPEHRLIVPRQCIDGRVAAEGFEPSQELIGDHAEDCGAHVRFEAILPFMFQHADTLRQAVASKGIVIDDALQQQIKDNMKGLLETGYIATGPQLQQAFIDTAGVEVLPKLGGKHIEVAARENYVPGTTLNRTRARAAYPGRNLDAFNIDAWSFAPSARILVPRASERDILALTVGMHYYNTATALVLCDESLLVGASGAAV